jgi:hypothetical protein
MLTEESGAFAASETREDGPNRYYPIDGGWRIHLDNTMATACRKSDAAIGAVLDDARLHRRPLYPSSERTLVWTAEELAQRPRIPFRPIVLAANEPRFVVDLDSAGGLSGHVFIGLSLDHGPSKWFHQFDNIEVRYVYGRMEYTLSDAAFPNTRVWLKLLPLAESVGLVIAIRIEGVSQPGELVWMVGGSSGFTTNYKHDSPEYKFFAAQCSENVCRWEGGRFAILRGGTTKLRGGGSWPAECGFGDPGKANESPAALCVSAQCRPTADRREFRNCVVVQRFSLDQQTTSGHLVVGLGGKIESYLADPSAAEDTAEKRCLSLANRITIHTPDRYLNQAVPMMSLCTDGIWGDVAILHGAWSWRLAYLGWRGWYGPMCYGWADRVKHSIEQHCALGVVDDGPDKGQVACMLESPAGQGYNMDEVFIDQVRQYYEYTNDVELMRRVVPILKGILAWENRRLRPDPATPLYESALDTWVSDSHWYIRGQCTTASAYMLGAHRFMAEIAEALGEDASPYREETGRIQSAMQERLWQSRQGVFAEYLDTLGAQQLHPQPELPTIYHSAEFGAATPLQVYEMLHWVDNNLRQETTPGGGKCFWSSNWFPNNGRSYTHSTYELAYAEQLNLALTNYLVGRADEAYALLRGTLCGIYNGPTPGGLSGHMHVDGRQRMNNEFADAISMWGRAVVEGMFGIRPKRPRGIVELSPQFPSAWPEASITTPQFSYHWKRDSGRILIDWQSPIATAVELRMPLQAEKIDSVMVDGLAASYQLEPGVGMTWLNTKTPSATSGTISVSWVAADRRIWNPLAWKEGAPVTPTLADYAASDFLDPQSVLRDVKIKDGALRGTVAGETGNRLLFLKSTNESCPLWRPLTVHIEPKTPVKNEVWSPPPLNTRDLRAWSLVDMKDSYNASLSEALDTMVKVAPPPMPASTVNHGYWKAHLIGSHAGSPSDAAWRRKIGLDGIGWTCDGIPFKSPRQGKNLAVVTRAGGFPATVTVPMGVSGKTLYLMISGATFPVQSHVVNLRLTLQYSDGKRQNVEMVNPFGIGDCWNSWLGRFHDTAANGFENLGGRFGPPGSSAAGVMPQPIAVDTEAHLIGIPLRSGVTLQDLVVEAVANDVIFGLMGATVLK